VALAGVVGLTATSAQAQYRTPTVRYSQYPAAPVTRAPTVRYSQYPAAPTTITRVPAPVGRPQQSRFAAPVTRAPAPVGCCNYYGGVGYVDRARVRAPAFNDNATAEQVVREILEAIGIPARSVMVRPGDVPSAAALVDGSTRLILYNQAFLATIRTQAGTNWTSYGVMVHEVAHLLIGHTLEPGGSRPHKELEADRYSGFVLYNLHATLDEAVSATQTLPDGEGSATHPPKHRRIQAVIDGWNDARMRSQGRQPGIVRIDPDLVVAPPPVVYSEIHVAPQADHYPEAPPPPPPGGEAPPPPPPGGEAPPAPPPSVESVDIYPVAPPPPAPSVESDN
jgi:hypothetical protein